MAAGDADVKITAGYTQNVIGFGWTNAVYLKMEQLLSRRRTGMSPRPADSPKSAPGG